MIRHSKTGEEGAADSLEGTSGRRASYTEGLSFSILSFGSVVLVGLVSAIVTARIYGIEVIGQFALATAPVNAVWYLSSVREQAALMRELATLPARAPRVTGLFAAVCVFSSVLTLVVAAIAVGISYLAYSGPVGQPQLFLPAVASMGGYVLFTNAGWNFETVLNAFRAGRAMFWIRLAQLVVFLCVATVLGVAVGTVWGLVIATVFSSFTGLVHRALRSLEFMRIRISWAEIRDGFSTLPDLIRFGIKIAPGTAAEGISNECGTWALGIFASVSVVGAYNRAWTLGRRLIEGAWRITEMLYPTLVERRARGDAEGFDRALIDTIRYSAGGMLLLAAVGGGAAHGVMAVFGPGFDRASDALALLLLMPGIFTVLSIQRHALFSVDRPLATTAIGIVRMLATLSLLIPLTLALGATGAALAIIVGLLVEAGYMFWTTRRHLERPLHELWTYQQMLAVALAYASGFAAARGADSSVGGIPGTLLAMVIGVVEYASIYVLAGGLSARDRERCGVLVDSLRRRRRLRRLDPQAQS
jgi:O-antigen/teichoic acid export membrane protein